MTQPSGRWPPDVVLTHSPECVPGVCVDWCVAVELDKQTAHLHSSGSPKGPGGWDSEGGWGFIGKGPYGQARVGDSGGASRFFPQFWHYTNPPTAKRRTTVQLIHGDCLDALRTLPSCSVDSVVTDPPYALSDLRKRDGYCLRQILSEIQLPSDDDRDAKRSEGGHLPRPTVGVAPLRVVDGAARVDARVGVPEGAVDLQCSTVGQQEVHDAHVAALDATDGNLALELDAEPAQFFGHFVLQPTYRSDLPFCDVSCSCFAEEGPGVLRVAVALPRSTGSDLTSALSSRAWPSGADVLLANDTAGHAQPSASIVAGPGAVACAVLRLDLSRGTGELRPADSALHGPPLFLLAPSKGVGAGSGASGLPTVSEPNRVRLVDGMTDGTLAVHGAWHKLNLTRSARGFMGKTWDGWDTPGSYQRWCYAWAQELFRVLKPGGHLLAFGGTRTYHRMVCAIEDAGFECRDTIQWIHGQGFPKSLDVSKALDKAAGAPATELAERFAGFGTALKPAHEPIVLARKPLDSTVAGTVTRWGTGALNIDGCRVGTDPVSTHSRGVNGAFPKRPTESTPEESGRCTWQGDVDTSSVRSGRWPADVVLSHNPTCDGVCSPDCAVAELDKQSGTIPGSARIIRRDGHSGGIYGPSRRDGEQRGYTGEGGASRFFPTFKYQAKPSGREKSAGLDDRNTHPTVKPVELMRWLVRLVTPPGGTVLDPFAGSGSTLVAATLEGFDSIGIEAEAEYLPLIEGRVRWAEQQVEQPALSFD